MAVPIILKDKTKELIPAQRKKVEACAARLIAEEVTRRELPHAQRDRRAERP
jgi:hypothetical protein